MYVFGLWPFWNLTFEKPILCRIDGVTQEQLSYRFSFEFFVFHDWFKREGDKNLGGVKKMDYRGYALNFHCIGTLAQFSLEVAISICVCVVCAIFFFALYYSHHSCQLVYNPFSQYVSHLELYSQLQLSLQSRHAICHGCTDIICVKYLILWVNFCSELTVFCQK